MLKFYAFPIIILSLIFFVLMPLEAKITKGKIKVEITSGILKGKVYLGEFTYDDKDLKGKGSEIMGVKPGGQRKRNVGGLKTFKFNFVDLVSGKSSKIYTEKDVYKFSEESAIGFKDGVPFMLGIVVEKGDRATQPRHFQLNQIFSYHIGSPTKRAGLFGRGDYKIKG